MSKAKGWGAGGQASRGLEAMLWESSLSVERVLLSQLYQRVLSG
jgi:hypothetical protein